MNYINEVPIDIRLFREGAQVPSHADDGSAGYDVYAWTDITEKTYGIKIAPHTMEVIKTGINIRIPRGLQVLVLPRSGNAFKSNITIINSPGLIDSSYDGDGEDYEIKVGLFNHGDDQFIVKHGDRIAQLLLVPALFINWNIVNTDNINRPIKARTGGFGSTGV